MGTVDSDFSHWNWTYFRGTLNTRLTNFQFGTTLGGRITRKRISAGLSTVQPKQGRYSWSKSWGGSLSAQAWQNQAGTSRSSRWSHAERMQTKTISWFMRFSLNNAGESDLNAYARSPCFSWNMGKIGRCPEPISAKNPFVPCHLKRLHSLAEYFEIANAPWQYRLLQMYVKFLTQPSD